MKTADVAKALDVSEESVSLRKGVYTLRKGFYYTHGFTSQMLADRVSKAFPNATIVSHEEIWKSFKGGASLRDSSHWCVKFTLPQG